MKNITAEAIITIKVGEVSIELTKTEAEQLYNSLGTVLNKDYISVPYIHYYPTESIPCSPTWTECNGDNTVHYTDGTESTTIIINKTTAEN